MRYYVNKNAQANGDHEVHTVTCSFLPNEDNRTYLGAGIDVVIGSPTFRISDRPMSGRFVIG